MLELDDCGIRLEQLETDVGESVDCEDIEKLLDDDSDERRQLDEDLCITVLQLDTLVVDRFDTLVEVCDVVSVWLLVVWTSVLSLDVDRTIVEELDSSGAGRSVIVVVAA